VSAQAGFDVTLQCRHENHISTGSVLKRASDFSA